ncbi:MAG: hypothetical protein HKM93_19220 [Desulfobacteraceae bacterium]|nr:hypothetical protein [Desulfobacteraceae bacterium]
MATELEGGMKPSKYRKVLIAGVVGLSIAVFSWLSNRDIEVVAYLPTEMACPSSHTLTVVTDLHYPGLDNCADARTDAEASLQSFHYEKACRKVTGDEQVADARLVDCGTAADVWDSDSRGIVVAVEVCCGEPLK